MTPGLHPFAVNHVVFTDGKFHNLGIGVEKKFQDPGRYEITMDKEDWGLSSDIWCSLPSSYAFLLIRHDWSTREVTAQNGSLCRR